MENNTFPSDKHPQCVICWKGFAAKCMPRKSFCFEKFLLRNVLDTCRVNASTVIALNQSIEPRNTNSFDFEITLVLQLVRPFVALRLK